MNNPWQQRLADDGFAVLSAVFAAKQIDAITQSLDDAFARDQRGATLRAMDGSVYGARNLMQLWPDVIRICRHAPLPKVLSEVLGGDFGLVRVLYFDKPPEQSWALPWHKDLTIAVENNQLPSEVFCKPTKKIGVPHVEAPRWLLERMLTLRLHLDDVTTENGPLKVLPGSHRGNEDGSPATILGPRGDVLLMRPLLSHCSNKSCDGTTRRRRVLHFEFAATEELPDCYSWHDYVRPLT